MKKKILLIDDHELVREGIAALLNSETDYEVSGSVGSLADALDVVRQRAFDVIVMDLSMPDVSGTEAVRSVRDAAPRAPIAVLTVHKADEYIHAALSAGANGYLLKEDGHAELVGAVRHLLAGHTYLSPTICSRVVKGYLQPGPARANGKGPLTPRELQIVALVVDGYRNKDIAAHLSLSLKTVEKHRSNLMRKLGVRSASGLAAYAIENGLTSRV